MPTPKIPDHFYHFVNAQPVSCGYFVAYKTNPMKNSVFSPPYFLFVIERTKHQLHPPPKNQCCHLNWTCLFILGGYSFSLKYSPAFNYLISVLCFCLQPGISDNMMSKPNFDNRDFKGDLKLETSFAVFADYFSALIEKGLHFGPSVFSIPNQSDTWIQQKEFISTADIQIYVSGICFQTI